MKSETASTIFINKKRPIKTKAPKHDACLVVMSGKEENRKFNLYIEELHEKIIHTYDFDSEFFHNANDIYIDDNQISSNHAKLIRKENKFYLTDNDSTTGTFLNGDRVLSEVLLQSQDIITIGNTNLKFLQGDIEALFLDSIREKINIDRLTNAYNKHFFNENLKKTFSLSRRHNKDLSLILFDIDNFKSINDTFGHPAGDYILSEIGRLINSNIRDADVFARVGGEEFGILCPETAIENAVILGEKIRKLISINNFVFDNTLIPITVSLGICSFDNSIRNECELYEKCDQNLYRAKRTGKNRVCW